MSRFSGTQYKGAGRDARRIRREEAQERDSRSAHEREGRRARARELDPGRYSRVGNQTIRLAP